MKAASPVARYAVPLRRWWPIVAVALGIGVIAGLVMWPDAQHEPTAEQLADPDIRYRATQVLHQNAEAAGAPSLDLVLLLARQGELTNRVVDRLGGEVTPAEVDAVELEPNEELGTLSVTTVQQDPDVAEELARAYSRELNALLVERTEASVVDDLERTEERLAGLTERIADLERELEPLGEEDIDRRLLEAELNALVTRFGVDQAEALSLEDDLRGSERAFETLQEPSAVSTDVADGETRLEVPDAPFLRFALIVAAALALGMGVVLGIDHLDTRIRTRKDAEQAYGLPVIGELPSRSARELEQAPLPALSDPAGATAEAIRSLRLATVVAPTWRLSSQAPTDSGAVGSVAPIREHAAPRSIVITSAILGQGKSALVANLAVSFAETGQRVLVVDCDFRRPGLARLLAAQVHRGLRDVDDPFESSLGELVASTKVSKVGLLPAGSAGIAPSWFLPHGWVLVEQAIELADVVLLDTGPMALTNEALALIPSVDTALLVNRAGKVPFAKAQAAVEQLTRVGANVAGIAMVGTNEPRRYGYYQAGHSAASRPLDAVGERDE